MLDCRLGAKQESIKHGAPFTIWTNRHWDEDSTRVVEMLDDFFTRVCTVSVAVSRSRTHELASFLGHEVLDGEGRLIFCCCTTDGRRIQNKFKGRRDSDINANIGVGTYGRCSVFDGGDGLEGNIKRTKPR